MNFSKNGSFQLISFELLDLTERFIAVRTLLGNPQCKRCWPPRRWIEHRPVGLPGKKHQAKRENDGESRGKTKVQCWLYGGYDGCYDGDDGGYDGGYFWVKANISNSGFRSTMHFSWKGLTIKLTNFRLGHVQCRKLVT